MLTGLWEYAYTQESGVDKNKETNIRLSDPEGQTVRYPYPQCCTAVKPQSTYVYAE